MLTIKENVYTYLTWLLKVVSWRRIVMSTTSRLNLTTSLRRRNVVTTVWLINVVNMILVMIRWLDILTNFLKVWFKPFPAEVNKYVHSKVFSYPHAWVETVKTRVQQNRLELTKTLILYVKKIQVVTVILNKEINILSVHYSLLNIVSLKRLQWIFCE